MRKRPPAFTFGHVKELSGRETTGVPSDLVFNETHVVSRDRDFGPMLPRRAGSAFGKTCNVFPAPAVSSSTRRSSGRGTVQFEPVLARPPFRPASPYRKLVCILAVGKAMGEG